MRTSIICLIRLLPVLSLLPDATAAVRISPSDDFLLLACDSIKVDPKEIRKERFSFSIEATQIVVHGPMTENRKRSTEDMYAINPREFIDYFNSHVLVSSAPSLSVKEINIFTSDSGVTAHERPVIILEVEGVSADGRSINIRKAATGPAYSSLRVWSSSKNSTAIRSANIAFMAAFLRVILAFEEDLKQPSR